MRQLQTDESPGDAGRPHLASSSRVQASRRASYSAWLSEALPHSALGLKSSTEAMAGSCSC